MAKPCCYGGADMNNHRGSDAWLAKNAAMGRWARWFGMIGACVVMGAFFWLLWPLFQAIFWFFMWPFFVFGGVL